MAAARHAREHGLVTTIMDWRSLAYAGVQGRHAGPTPSPSAPVLPGRRGQAVPPGCSVNSPLGLDLAGARDSAEGEAQRGPQEAVQPNQSAEAVDPRAN